MAVSAISNLSTWLNQVNGSKSQNLNALGSSKQSTGTSQTSGTGSSQASGQLAALFENLLQQLVAAGGTTSAAGAATSAIGSTASATGSATQTAAQSAAQNATQGLTQSAQSHAHHAHGSGGMSTQQQTALNRLLQELKLGSSSTTTTAASAAGSAQSTGSQQLMSMLQHLAQGGSSAVGSIVSALV